MHGPSTKTNDWIDRGSVRERRNGGKEARGEAVHGVKQLLAGAWLRLAKRAGVR